MHNRYFAVCFRAIGKMWLVLFWPLFPFFLHLGVVAYWVTSALYPLIRPLMLPFSCVLWLYCAGHGRVNVNDRTDRVVGISVDLKC